MSDDYAALRHDAGAVWLPRDFVSVTGPDALAFMQGQLSQQIDMPAGESTWALLLQPQGKMVALLRVLREAEDRFVLDTDEGFGPVVADRLIKFKLRVKAEIEPLEWKCLAVRGPRSHDVVPRGLVADWPGLPGCDLVGESPEVPDGARLCSLEAYEAVRIEAGIPMMGREIDENTIPAETGVVDMTVDFDKGCYTGQELVARIDSRGGNVPKRLRGLVIGSDVRPPLGSTVRFEEKDVGRVTSVGQTPERHVALAYVGRAVTPPADVTLAWDGGTAPARVEPLPLVS
ncbi:MAG: YgfZ/GcvT domain-containing protein [Acidimicrobiales bacterium]